VRVVCVDDSGEDIQNLLKKGMIYTVIGQRTLLYAGNRNYKHETFILSEIRNNTDDRRDIGFYKGRFRPLDESRLDQFRVHLKTVPKRVEERV